MQKASEFLNQLTQLKVAEAEALRITRSKIDAKELTDDLAPAPAVTLKDFDELLASIATQRTALATKEEAPVQRSAQGAPAKDDFLNIEDLHQDLSLHIERSSKRGDVLAQAQGVQMQLMEQLTRAVVKLSDQIASIGQRTDNQFVEIQRSLASRVPAGPRALTGAQPLPSPNEEGVSKQATRVAVHQALTQAIQRSAAAISNAATPGDRAAAQAKMEQLRHASSQLSGGADPATVAANAGIEYKAA